MPAPAPARPCPVCGASPKGAPVFVEGSIDPARLDRFSFASRKMPEFMSHRMVRCRTGRLWVADGSLTKASGELRLPLPESIVHCIDLTTVHLDAMQARLGPSTGVRSSRRLA